MKKHVVFLLFVLFLLPVFYCESQIDIELQSRIRRIENGLRPANFAENDAKFSITGRMENFKVPGVSIAVFSDFKIDWAKGYGVMDAETGEPVTERTLFQAASISKPVAAMAALKFAQDGKIKLDGNINDILKSWKLPENKFTSGQPVTLSHILSHSAGLTVHGFRGYKVSEPQPSLRQILDGEEPANSGAIRVDMAPGTKFRYSGGGYTIMQQALIDLTGKPFPQIMKETVLDPLRMDYSTYDQPLPESILKFSATGYQRIGEEVEEKRHIYPEMAAAGLWTTPSDLAKFAIEVQLSIAGKSEKVLSREMAQKMVTAFADTVYGLGFSLARKDYFGHGGSNNGFKCGLIAHMETGFGIVIMTNGDLGGLLAPEIQKAIIEEYFGREFLDKMVERS